MKNWIKDIIRRIKRIADFLPIIWKGRDFDYNYSIELFHYQLERTAKFLESDKAYSLNSNVDAQKIRTAIKLGERVFNEYYQSEWTKLVDNRFGPNALKFHFEDTGRGDGSSYLKYNYEYWDNADEVHKFIDEHVNVSRLKQEKAERIYWEYLQHNLKRWWD